MTSRYGMIVIMIAVALAGSAHAQSKAHKAPPSQPIQAPGTTDKTGWTAPAATPAIDTRPVVPPPSIAAPSTTPVKGGMPTWSEFPVPTDVPAVTDIAQRVKVQTDARRSISAEVKVLTWDNLQAEPFASATHARMDPKYATPVNPVQVQKDIQTILSRHFTPPPQVN